jgi:hypothetical protein
MTSWYSFHLFIIFYKLHIPRRFFFEIFSVIMFVFLCHTRTLPPKADVDTYISDYIILKGLRLFSYLDIGTLSDKNS